MRYVILALRIIGVGAGVALIIVGMPLLVTPIPLGVILISLGVLLLLISSNTAAGWLRARRAHNPRFDAHVRRFEEKAPGIIRAILRGTRPDAR